MADEKTAEETQTQTNQIPPAPPINPPNEIKERTTEQFEKLLKSNQELFKKLEDQSNKYQDLLNAQMDRQKEVGQREQTQNTFNQIDQTKPTPAQTQSNVNANDFLETDEYGGQVVNLEKLNKYLSQNSEKVAQTEKQVQTFMQNQQKQDEVRQTQEAYATYPELNPEAENHDRDFTRLTRQILTDSYAYPTDYGGIPLTYKQAAERAKVYTEALNKGASHAEAQAEVNKEAEKQEAERKAQAEKAEEQKQEASAEATGNSQQGKREITDAEYSNLVLRTRSGDDEALAHRLMGVERAKTQNIKEE